MRNSTTDRSPPIAMPSPCTVATKCLPLMVSLLPLPLASFVPVTVPISFAALGALLASFLASIISLAARPFISSFPTMPCSWLTCWLCVLSRQWRTRLHMTCRCSCRSHSALSSCHACRRSPDPSALVRQSIISFTMISSFSTSFVKISRYLSRIPV